MSKKCKRCGACQECGNVPAPVYPGYPYTQPYPNPIYVGDWPPNYPNYWPTTWGGTNATGAFGTVTWNTTGDNSAA